jgi:hypothetical protein
MEPFNLDAFDSPEHVLAHLVQLPPAKRAGIELELRMRALAEVCAPPTAPSPEQQDTTQRLRKKYAGMLQ